MRIIETCNLGNVAPGSLVQLVGTDIKLRVLVDRAQCPELDFASGKEFTSLCVEELVWELRRVSCQVMVEVFEKSVFDD